MADRIGKRTNKTADIQNSLYAYPLEPDPLGGEARHFVNKGAIGDEFADKRKKPTGILERQRKIFNRFDQFC